MGLGMRVRQFSWRLGYEIHDHLRGGHQLWRGLRRVQLVGPLRCSGRLLAGPIEVDVERCTSFLGLAFSTQGWNPLVATLRQYEANPDLVYEDSVFAQVHQRFLPQTLRDLFFPGSAQPQAPLNTLGVDRRYYRYIWKVSPQMAAGAKPGTFSPNYSFGPLDPSQGQAEFDRLIKTYLSIREHGYQPKRYNYVTGYFLGDDANYRFVIGSGNHRVAALAVLGTERMEVQLHSHPASIHRDQLSLWTPAEGGLFPIPTAEALFDRFLHGDGSVLADHLGLRTKPADSLYSTKSNRLLSRSNMDQRLSAAIATSPSSRPNVKHEPTKRPYDVTDQGATS